VPRFYEKVWNQFAATDAGRFWISLPDGALKRSLAAPLRRVVLRKAGLDRCRQLLVGSAPIGMELLESFRSLGVEIHNAFGVTEAPLITLSRLGENELGSVGALLPDTEARIGDDGQVYVRGPQVTCGYDGALEPAVDEDGWFCTGDLATWSEAGNLVLNGRKKEILVTSYGKNIAPQKIEVLLKGIDGVSEAMVVADGRPFTTALIWLEDVVDCDFDALDAAVRAVNVQLSYPEQVKRWIVAAQAASSLDRRYAPRYASAPQAHFPSRSFCTAVSESSLRGTSPAVCGSGLARFRSAIRRCAACSCRRLTRGSCVGFWESTPAWCFRAV